MCDSLLVVPMLHINTKTNPNLGKTSSRYGHTKKCDQCMQCEQLIIVPVISLKCRQLTYRSTAWLPPSTTDRSPLHCRTSCHWVGNKAFLAQCATEYWVNCDVAIDLWLVKLKMPITERESSSSDKVQTSNSWRFLYLDESTGWVMLNRLQHTLECFRSAHKSEWRDNVSYLIKQHYKCSCLISILGKNLPTKCHETG